MKSLGKMFIAFTLMMLLGLVVLVSAGKKITYEKRDILYYNDLLHRIQDDLEAGMTEEDAEEKYDCVISMSKEINDSKMTELYANRALVLDISIDGEYVGKVGWDDDETNYVNARKDFLKAALVLWIIILLSGYVLLIYMLRVFIKPIEELKDFSSDIAKGDLDKPLPIRKNNMFGSFVEGFDIMREQLRDSIDRERRAEIARKELVQGLSHDIKTPLSVIKATCEVIELKYSRKLRNISGEDEQECRDLVEKIDSISDKADTISSLMSDVMHANLEELEKVNVVAQEEKSTIVEDFFRNLSDYGNIILENSIHPCLVYMDRKRMEQVIDNIVGNSAKYAGTDIRVSFAQTEEIPLGDGTSATFIKITVRDSGPGADKDELPLLAEKYYRGRNATGKGGYGLGMYLCRTYMDKQGGGMEFYNDNGFVVELLLRKV